MLKDTSTSFLHRVPENEDGKILKDVQTYYQLVGTKTDRKDLDRRSLPQR